MGVSATKAGLALVCSVLVLGFCNVSTASEVSFYGKAAAALFDLIKTPSSIRHFDLQQGSRKIGCTQIRLGTGVECTIHGTAETYPATSADAQLALCSFRDDANIRVVFGPTGGGSISIEGENAQNIFGLLSKVDYSSHDDLDKQTLTMKSSGRAGVDGFSCNEVVPDDKTQTTRYGCSVSWQ